MEEVLKTIQTKKGATVSLIKPDNGNPFFRYLAGAVATTDAFRYVIRQHGQEDTATVNIQVNAPQNEQPNDQKDFLSAFDAFLNCVDAFMDGTPSTMALTNLLGIDEGDVLNDDWLRTIFANFRYFDTAKDAPDFNLQQYTGTYFYRIDAGYWDFQPGGDVILLQFPSSQNAKENDAEWRLNQLEINTVQTDTDLHHLPTTVDMQLTVANKPILEIRAEKIVYLENTALPISINLEAVAFPYILRFKLSKKNEKEFDVRCTVSDEDGCNLDLNTRWLVNQDLKQKLQGENIQLAKGELSLNEITVTGLETLWMATQQSIYEQQKLDDLLKLTCLMAGKKIGDLKYQIREEIVELVFEDGKRLNVNEIIKEHFKKYFNAPKPDGQARNNAFDPKAHTTFRAVPRETTSVPETKEKVVKNLTEAVRRRTIKLGSTTPVAINSVVSLFKKEAPKGDFAYSPSFIDSEGTIIPLVDAGITSPGHGKLFTVPDTVIVTPKDKRGVIATPERVIAKDTIKAVPKATATAASTPKPITSSPAKTTVKSTRAATTVKATPVKAATVKPISTGAKAASTLKPVTSTPAKTTVKSTRAATAVKATPVKAATVKPISTSAKAVTPAKTATAKATTTKKTIKPK